MLRRVISFVLVLVLVFGFTFANASSFEEDMLYYVNLEREKHGISPLSLDATLCNVALVRAMECQYRFEKNHRRPDGRPFYTALYEFDLVYSIAGENLISGAQTPEIMVASWMTSKTGHREAILNPEYTHLGTAYYDAPDGTRYGVQTFTGGHRVVPGTKEAKAGGQKQHNTDSGANSGFEANQSNGGFGDGVTQSEKKPASDFMPTQGKYATPEHIKNAIELGIYGDDNALIGTAYITSGHTSKNVKIYANPSTKSKRLKTIPRCAQFGINSILYDKNSRPIWYEAEYNGVNGFVRAKDAQFNLVVGYLSSKVSVKSDPSPKSKTIAVMPKKTKFSAEYVGNGYYYAEFDGEVAGFIGEKNVINTLLNVR